MNDQNKIEKSVNLLMDICIMMMRSGANTKRVIDNINRFAKVLNLESHALISHKSIIMTLKDLNTKETYTVVNQIPGYTIDFTVVSDISRASWKALDRNWSFEKISNRINEIRNKRRYPLWLELLTVSLAGAGFAKIFGGDVLNMGITFIATLFGFSVSKFMHHKAFNPYIRTYISSVVASFVATLGIIFSIGSDPHIALATSVLFLV
ncbi:MAG TPA: threonine/serine exporter, partial [Bacteroidetes bacterium]|nr:threonine/serine exporter [Bacteroidota bacterium]